MTINHDAVIHERKIICIGFKWEDDPKVHVLRWDHNQCDRTMLMQFLAIAEDADEIVAHYGNGFDFPWIRTRCLYHRLPPIPIYKTVDTKALASKYFYFNSNKLDYISSFLGHGRKLKTEFDLWKKILLDNDIKALDYMCKYCGIDVRRLESVYKDLMPYVKPQTHHGVLMGKDKWTCPRCGSSNVEKSKTRVSAAGTVTHQMRCLDDGSYFTISEKAFSEYQETKNHGKRKK